MTTEATDARSRLDGVRPKHAACTACGYGVAGIPIHNLTIVCPECGTPVLFDALPRAGNRQSPVHRSPLVLLALLIVLASVLALVL